MYQVIVKGRNLEELKKAVNDINAELNNNNSIVNVESVKEVEKVLDENITPAVEEVKAPVNPTVEPGPVNVAYEANAELDVRGLPWDSRIHAKTKTKNADGSWRNRRNLDKDLLAQVEAELKTVYSQSQPEEVAPLNPATTPNVSAEPTLPLQTVESPTVGPAPTLAPPQMNTMNGHTVETFSQNYPMIINDLINQQKIDQNYLNQLKSYFGVSELWELNDEQKSELFNSFVSYGFVQKA